MRRTANGSTNDSLVGFPSPKFPNKLVRAYADPKISNPNATGDSGR
jgi:hypothetical protein